MHVEGAAGDAHSFCNLVVLLQPGEIKAWWENPSKKDLFFLVLLQSWAGLRNNSSTTDGKTETQEDKAICLRSGTELAGSDSWPLWVLPQVTFPMQILNPVPLWGHWPDCILGESGSPQLQAMIQNIAGAPLYPSYHCVAVSNRCQNLGASWLMRATKWDSQGKQTPHDRLGSSRGSDLLTERGFMTTAGG